MDLWLKIKQFGLDTLDHFNNYSLRRQDGLFSSTPQKAIEHMAGRTDAQSIIEKTLNRIEAFEPIAFELCVIAVLIGIFIMMAGRKKSGSKISSIAILAYIIIKTIGGTYA